MKPDIQEIVNSDVVQSAIQAAADYIGREAANSFRFSVSKNQLPFAEIHSVTEAIFYVWWKALCGQDASLVLRCQVPVTVGAEFYRLDFVIEPSVDTASKATDLGVAWSRVCVEVDGHAFHEKTVEQVTLRNKRDRDLQQDGWRVFHISYSELVGNSEKVVGDVLLFGYKQFIDMGRQILQVQAATRQEPI